MSQFLLMGNWEEQSLHDYDHSRGKKACQRKSALKA
jgi:hypothetical protein